MNTLKTVGIVSVGLSISLLGAYLIDGIEMLKFMCGFVMLLGGISGTVAWGVSRRVR
jgi:hypothetical protein